ncbi:class I SAM-dependent methyltransferase [candidate division KSB1 bacterium]
MGLHVCPWWLSFVVDNYIRRVLQNPKKILGNYIKEGQTVVDIGCGPGFFTIPIARMVGDKGRVIAADVQERMLDKVHYRAEKTGLLSRIKLHQCGEKAIGIDAKADFVLAMYMVHEVPDKEAFLKEIAGMLKEDGIFFVSEPMVHVKDSDFKQMVETAEEAGLKPVSELKLTMSRTALFKML